MVNSIAMTVPLAFEPKSQRLMAHPPRRPDQPLLSPPLVRRIALISVVNWVLIFGLFETIRRSSGIHYLGQPKQLTLSICTLTDPIYRTTVLNMDLVY